MPIVEIIAAFMLAAGSPSFVINNLLATENYIEVDVQSASPDVGKRYILLIEGGKVTNSVGVPYNNVGCQAEQGITT